MVLLFKPFALLLSALASRVAAAAFATVWDIVDGEEVPAPTTPGARTSRVVLAAALQGALAGAIYAAITRGGAKGWERVFGVWPGDSAPADDETARA